MKRKDKSSSSKNPDYGHPETRTYKLGGVQANPEAAEKSANPFTLPLRDPGWFPDGIELPWHKVQRLFPEEIVGGANGRRGGKQAQVPIPFEVQFSDDEAEKQGREIHEWVVGKLFEQPSAAELAKKGASLTALIAKLAQRMRNYNASLYTLRRLHMWFDFGVLMRANPDGQDPAKLPRAKSPRFRALARAAEQDWIEVTDEITDFIQTNVKNNALVAVDMVEVNSYVVAMRVVAPAGKTAPGKASPMEMTGSSSQVSISSTFSSTDA
jgi:hypothetical protein